MGRRVSVTNLALGPRGWPEIGKAQPTILKRGQTETLEVPDNIFQTLQRMASGDKPEIELEDLGEVEDTGLAARVATIENALAVGADGNVRILGDVRVGQDALSVEDVQAAVDKALESVKGDLETRDQTIERQAQEIERLTTEAEGRETETDPKTYTVGPFVSKVCQAFDIQNFQDLQLVLDAIEAAFEPFAKFDPDGDLKPGGAAGAEIQEGETQDPTKPPPGPQTDQFDDMDDVALRKFIFAQTQKEPHPNAKRETLLKKAREAEADAGEAV